MLPCLLLLLLTLTACAGGSVPPTAVVEPAAAEPLPALDTPAPTPTDTPAIQVEATEPPVAPMSLRVAVNPEFQPFVYQEDTGQLVGFDIDLLNAMATAGAFEVTYTTVPFSEIFDGLRAGRFDAAISGLSITQERQQTVAFTDVYFETGQALMSYFGAGQGLAVPIDNTSIQSVDDLTTDMLVGVKAETTGDAYVRENSQAQVRTYTEAPTALDALRAGEVNAVVLDIAVLAEAIGVDASIKLVGAPITSEQYAIAVPTGRPQVLARLNQALEQIRADGTYAVLIERWFGMP